MNAVDVGHSALLLAVLYETWQLRRQSSQHRLSMSLQAQQQRLEKRFGLRFDHAQLALWSAFLSLVVYYDDAVRVERQVRDFFAQRKRCGSAVHVKRVLLRTLVNGPQYLFVELQLPRSAHSLGVESRDSSFCPPNGVVGLLAVRGTNHAADWRTNVSFVGLTGSGSTKYGVSVHKGWLAFAHMIFDELVALGIVQRRRGGRRVAATDTNSGVALDADDEQDNDDEINDNSSDDTTAAPAALSRNASVCFAGHSMGGAVASLLACLFAEHAHWPGALAVNTFGAPAIGGPDVSRLPCLRHAHCFVRPGDVVPRRVPALGYAQHGYDVLLEPNFFDRVHSSSHLGRQRAESAGGVLQTAALVKALGFEPHDIVGYFREIEALFGTMQTHRARL